MGASCCERASQEHEGGSNLLSSPLHRLHRRARSRLEIDRQLELDRGLDGKFAQPQRGVCRAEFLARAKTFERRWDVRMPFKAADRGAGIFLTLRPSLNLPAPRRD